MLSELDELTTLLWEFGTLGTIENDGSLLAFFPDTVDLSELKRIYKCRVVQQVDCGIPESHSKPEHSDPILAGKQFFIVPFGSPAVAPSGRTRIEIDAQNAFGSGSHESTQLVIQALEEHLRPDSVMIDIGSGSGVLSAVAQKLRGKTLFACDTHLDSVLLTRFHAPGVHAFAGSVDAVSSGSADLVVANISARVIDLLAPHLSRVARPNALIILAGFIAEQPPQSFTPTLETCLNEWRCWICKPCDLAVRTVSGESKVDRLQPFPSEWW